MCTVGEIAACQITFIPVGSGDYLENTIGILSTVVRGEKNEILKLITDLYNSMDSICSFVMDIKISNLCGCKK